jgi:hypothetical protein
VNRTTLLRAVNRPLGHLGLKLTRDGRQHDWTDTRDFIPFKATLAAASAAGLSVPDFVDQVHNRPGATSEAIEQMSELGVFSGAIEHVCEIGPGSGRYLEKVLRFCQPSRYEIYETADEWADWLVRQYNVVRQPTDGRTLSATASGSVNLVMAHKVFPSIPTIITCGYLEEIARVLRRSGVAVFDIVTEDCLDDETLAAWYATGLAPGPYPAVMPRRFVVELLERRGLVLIGSFMVAMRPGHTECLAFRCP